MATITTLSPDLLRDIKQLIESHGRQTKGNLSNTPRDVPKAPDDYIVKTPSGGIAARSGNAITGVSCAVYKLTGNITGGSLTMSAISGFALMVYNLSNEAVEGDKYVVTSLLKSGVRYVVLESCNAEE